MMSSMGGMGGMGGMGQQLGMDDLPPEPPYDPNQVPVEYDPTPASPPPINMHPGMDGQQLPLSVRPQIGMGMGMGQQMAGAY